MESITKIRDSVNPIPPENLTIEVADHEDGASKVREGLRVFLRLERQDGKNVMLCAHAHAVQMQQILKECVVLQAEISTSLYHKYKKAHLLVVKMILLQDQMETETVLFSFVREMHS